MMTMDDSSQQIEALIAEVVLHDRSAYQQLYDLSSAKLFGICLRILKDRAEAEDALQEVFVNIWKKSSSYEASKARGITWMSAIARNHSIDRLRARRPFEESIDDNYELEDKTPGPEAAVTRSAVNKEIHDCLSALDNKHSEAVKRTYLNGWTYQQTADELKVPLNTLKTWIRRSLIALRECMNK